MRLKILKGQSVGKVIPLDHSVFTIGRELDNRFIIDESGVSRHHCILTPIGDKWFVEDCKSINGVLVNGVRIDQGTELHPGDVVAIYNHEFQFLGDQDAPEARRPAVTIPPRSPAAPPPLEPVGEGSGASSLRILVWAVILAALAFAAYRFKDRLPIGKPGSEPPAAEQQAQTQTAEPGPGAETLPPAVPAESAAVGEGGLPEGAALSGGAPAAEGQDPAITFPAPAPARGMAGGGTGAAAVSSDRLPLLVRSDPPGARVWLDQTEREGVTPCIVPGLARGRHQLELRKDGYEPLKSSVQLSEETPDFAGELIQKPGTLLITSTPEHAQIWRGRQFIGVTPMLVAGIETPEYHYTLTYAGYETQQATAQVSDFRGSSQHTDMQSTLGQVEITTLPAGCRVHLGNILYGTTPVDPHDPYGKSLPLVVGNLMPGGILLKIEPDVDCGVFRAGKIEIPRKGVCRRFVKLPVPTHRLTLNDGAVKYGLLLELTELGDLVLEELHKRPERFLKPQIKELRKLDGNEITEYLQKAKAEEQSSGKSPLDDLTLPDFEKIMLKTTPEQFNFRFAGKKFKLTGRPVMISRDAQGTVGVLFEKSIRCDFPKLSMEEYEMLNGPVKNKITFSGTCTGIVENLILFSNCTIIDHFE